MDFTHYYGRHKNKNKAVAQIDVPQTKRFVVRAKVDEKLLRRIRTCGIKEGELIRRSITEHLDRIDKENWEKEVAEL